MHTLNVIAVLAPPGRLGPDEIADLMAAVIDALDVTTVEPDMSSAADDDGNVRFTLSLSVDAADEYQARARGSAALRDAFTVAGIVVEPGREPSSDLRLLQAV
ncbi:MAG: hypothetical protein ABSF03_25010 [Streptosporangiaceae bacterium]